MAQIWYDDGDDEEYDDGQEEEWGEEYEGGCHHEHDEDCEDYQGFNTCSHSHCMNCGGCECPGYCDDHRTYNLRPSETGGS